MYFWAMIRLIGAVLAEQDEDWSCRSWISEESLLLLSEPNKEQPAPNEETCKRARLLVQTALSLADADGKIA